LTGRGELVILYTKAMKGKLMKKFSVMGSHPGNGSVIEANDYYEAFVKFLCWESHGMVSEEEVRKDITREAWEEEVKQPDNDQIIYKGYQITKMK
jgi:hypothetical protein